MGDEVGREDRDSLFIVFFKLWSDVMMFLFQDVYVDSGFRRWIGLEWRQEIGGREIQFWVG